MLFLDFSPVERSYQAMTLKCSHLYTIETLHGFTVSKILKALTALAKTGNLAPLSNLVPSYILLHLVKEQFLIMRNWKHGFAPRKKSYLLLHGKRYGSSEAYVDIEVWKRPNPLDATHWFVTDIYLDHMALGISSNNLFTTQEGWTGFAQYALQTN